MYELNRIFLRNFGPHDARYENVTLDFSGVGAPVHQTALLTEDGYTDRRPSPASVLLLQNGGGKGVFLSAVMSTVVPLQFGDPTTLRDFVVSQRQPGHVVLEWSDRRDGRLLVTGQALAPDSKNKLVRYFYSFRPGRGLGADTLPFIDDNKWVSLTDYVAQLRAWQSGHDSLELYLDTPQEAWERQQTAIGLTPDLFAIQLRMNATEGGAASAVDTSNPGKFVDWLLQRTLRDDPLTKVADTFNTYAEEIRRYDQWRHEQVYAMTVRDKCADVHARNSELSVEGEAARATAKRLHNLANAIRGTVTILDEQCTTADARLAAARQQHKARENDATLATNRKNFVVLRDRELEHDHIASELESEKELADDAQRQLKAWSHVAEARDYSAAREAHRSVELKFTEAVATAEPFQKERDLAGARLRRAYGDAAQEQQHKAEQSRATAATLDAQVAEWGTEKSACHQDLGRLEANRGQFIARIKEFESHLDDARNHGLVTADETASDAAQRFSARQAELGSRIESATSTLQTARNNATTTSRDHTEAVRDQARMAAQHSAQQATIDKLRELAASVVNSPLTGQLLAVDKAELDSVDPLVWLDDNDRGIGEAASRIVNDANPRLSQRQIDDRLDRDLLKALDTSGGLLPPREEVRKVCDLLNTRDLPAFTGWDWMHQNVPAHQYKATIAQHPDLVDGVIVGNDAAVHAAEDILAANKHLSRGAIAIGTGQRLLTLSETPPSDRTVTTPTPAMYDEDAAATERQIVNDRLTERASEIESLQQRIQACDSLTSEIAHWRKIAGMGTVTAMLEAAQTLKDSVDEADEKVSVSAITAEKATVAATQAEKALSGLQEEHTTVARHHEQLQRLTVEETNAGAAQTTLDTVIEEVARHHGRLGVLADQITAAQKKSRRHISDAEQAEALADGYLQRCAGVVTSPDAETLARHDECLESLSTLLQRYESAEKHLSAVEVGDDLRAMLHSAHDDLQRAESRWMSIDSPLRKDAEALLSDARAATPAGRKQAQQEWQRTVDVHQTRVHELDTSKSVAKKGIEEARPRHGGTWLDDPETQQWTPTDRTHAEHLLTSATNALIQAKSAHRDAGNEVTAAERQRQQLKDKLAEFTPIAAKLETADPDMPTREPATYDGPAAQARELADKLITQFRTAKRRRDELARNLRQAVERLRRTNNSVEFEGVETPLRVQISTLEEDQIPEYVQGWATALGQVKETLESGIRHAEKNRNHLVRSVAEEVEKSFDILRKANRLSTVPDGPSPWANRRFLSITFDRPDHTALIGSVGNAVDEMARSHTKHTRKGLDIVMRCVHVAVARGFAVKVLKPTPTGRTKMEPIQQMVKIFSGGQGLTGAILLYCILAVLHSSPDSNNNRNRHGGTLFLDNPLGRANAEYLLDLQFSIAEAMGIQLIFTSPLSEDKAITRFPLQVHLHNDNETRSETVLIRLPKQQRRVLAPPPHDPDPEAAPVTGMLDAARLHIKDDDENQ